jgi:glycine amidinotransferase
LAGILKYANLNFMSVHVYTEWGPLKEVIVGDCFLLSDHNVDLSFRLFFHDNIKDELIQNSLSVQKRLVEQRQEDLDALAVQLEALGIVVHRPQQLERVESFATPEFTDHLRPVDNPRDQSFIYGNTIIETPCIWRSRYFENDLLKVIFQHYFERGSNWITAPRPIMKDESFDLSYVQRSEKQAIDWNYYDRLTKNFEIMFDGAQCLRFGRDILMNVSNENHRLGAKWLQSALKGQANLHLVELTDHHIDGMLMPLRPGLLLINHSSMPSKTDLLPPALQKWEQITVPYPQEPSLNQVALASVNIAVNVLPLSPDHVMIFGSTIDECAPLAELLEKEGLKVTAVQLRHSRLFGGGLHCVTLDTVREDALENFF